MIALIIVVMVTTRAEAMGNVVLSNYSYTRGDYASIDLAAKSVFYVEVYSPDYKYMGSGSGFVMFDEGLFITNQHVIEGSSYLLIVDDDGRQYVLDQVVISDEEHDIAILLFPEGENYSPLEYDSDFNQLKRGQPVLTIGSPKGLAGTVSDGIISAFPKFKDEDIRYIQITAPISHGSSGGCLLNEDLKVLGVTSAGVDEGQNLGFAIPVFIVEQLYLQWNKTDSVQLGTVESWDTVGHGLHGKVSGVVAKPQVSPSSSEIPTWTLNPTSTSVPPHVTAPISSTDSESDLSIAISAENGYNQVNWNVLSNVAKYEVYRDGRLIATTKLNEYKDSEVTRGTSYQYQINAILTSGAIIASESKSIIAKAALMKPKAGDYITFGTYPQTIAGNDSTPIEWLVLEVEDNKALLLSRYGLDAKPYNTKKTSVTWETCTLRMWLNSDFYQKAFSVLEREAIYTTIVDNSRNQGYSGWNTSGGNNTQDKIFLLSYGEAKKYLDVIWVDNNNMKSRMALTPYAVQQGAYVSDNIKTFDGHAAGRWWLRSPGSSQSRAANVIPGGYLYHYYVSISSGSVRPALWVNLESMIF